MAFINKKNHNYDKCSFCSNHALYLKDEYLLLCEIHGKSKLEALLLKKNKNIKDKQYLKKILLDICQTLKKIKQTTK